MSLTCRNLPEIEICVVGMFSWITFYILCLIINMVSIFLQGTTRMLLTKIPFFKEIVVMSFDCPHCGFKNNEVQSAGRIQDKGCTITLLVSSPKVHVLTLN